MERKTHYTDLLFTLTLFGIFAITALIVVMFGANVYQKTSADMDVNFTARTSVAYLSEKIRQNDTASNISVRTVDGMDALVLTQPLDDLDLETWIFCDGTNLREITIYAGKFVSLQDGEAILDLSSMSIEETEKGLLQFRLRDMSGVETTLQLLPRCGQEGA